MSNFSRRKFLQATATGAVLALAGCQSDMSKEDAMSASDIFTSISLREGEQGDFRMEHYLQVELTENPHANYDICTYNPALGMQTCTTYDTPAHPSEMTLELPNGDTREPTVRNGRTVEWVLQDSDYRLQSGEHTILTPTNRNSDAVLSFDMTTTPAIEEETMDVDESV